MREFFCRNHDNAFCLIASAMPKPPAHSSSSVGDGAANARRKTSARAPFSLEKVSGCRIVVLRFFHESEPRLPPGLFRFGAGLIWHSPYLLGAVAGYFRNTRAYDRGMHRAVVGKSYKFFPRLLNYKGGPWKYQKSGVHLLRQRIRDRRGRSPPVQLRGCIV